VECWEKGIVGLRTITPFGKGIYLRASLYHGVTYDEAVVLTNFMKEFAAKHSTPKNVEKSTTSLMEISTPLFRQSLDGDRPCAEIKFSPHKEYPQYNEFAAMSSSPDDVTASNRSSFTFYSPALTLPKNMKVNQYARVSHDMFSPLGERASPPPSLR
jgi:hypothetical protein